MSQHDTQSGFSAVELLITLFIGVAFIATGYQLYSAILGDGGAARSRAIASNLAYENLREQAGNTTPPACSTTATTTSITPPASSGLDNPTITATISAPQGCNGGSWTGTLMLVQVVVQYGPATPSPRPKVTHALYVNK
jgi:Tfp pilus assembly protein PilV